MAANFWTSSQSKMLMAPEDLSCAELHTDEAARGLTLTDLRLIKIHFCDHIRELALVMKLKQRVVATALLYLRRVFVKKSVLEMDPRLVSLACLYLASKAEEFPVLAKAVLKYLKSVRPCAGGDACGFGSSTYEMRDILEMEMRLLPVLDYNLITFHPYRPLTVLLADAAAALKLSEALRDKIMTDAWAMVNDSFRSDLCLLHPPHTVAAACLHLACVVAQVDTRSWFERLNLDVKAIQCVSLTLLEHYHARSSLPPQKMEAALRKLPPLANRPSPTPSAPQYGAPQPPRMPS